MNIPCSISTNTSCRFHILYKVNIKDVKPRNPIPQDLVSSNLKSDLKNRRFQGLLSILTIIFISDTVIPQWPDQEGNQRRIRVKE